MAEELGMFMLHVGFGWGGVLFCYVTSLDKSKGSGLFCLV